MLEKYQFAEIESKWQQRWRETQLYRSQERADKPQYYALAMFPYPSGDRLHMGHMRTYTIADVVARYNRLKGFNLLHPMGWDAFGLPAENAAIQRGSHPGPWTMDNVAYMKQQMDQLGLSYDWSREINTCQPDYYRWTQWCFLQFYKTGLAVRREAAVNWCPSCQTVLANEQAEGGVCWRCDSPVTKKNLEQWFLKITHYAEELLHDLDILEYWPERVKTIQRNWIGRSEGAELQFAVEGMPRTAITIFTTRPDTAYGVTYMALAPEHPLVEKLTTPDRLSSVRNFQEGVRLQSEIERLALDRPKEGVPVGSFAVNPYSGERVPIWIADYVMMEYGTGAVMGVPAHDERDYAFARHHGLPIRQVIKTVEQAAWEAAPDYDPSQVEPLKAAYVDVGVMMNSGQFDNLVSTAGARRMTEYAVLHKFGRQRVTYRLRDWLISRQRYWGAPIPIIYCSKCGTVGVPEKDLPVLLPAKVLFGEPGQSPLATAAEFVNTACPECHGAARRETDTMDTFMDSSWYFLRYCDPQNSRRAFDAGKVDFWMPVDQYVGGVEHAAMHLLYARFFTKFLRDRGLLSVSEPFTALLNQGMVIKEGAKMSKSRGNVVSPDDIVRDYGADTCRLYILFAAPPDKDLEWSDEGIKGPHDFLRKVWRVATAIQPVYRRDWRTLLGNQDRSGPAAVLYRQLHRTIKRVGDDLERRALNTTVSTLMEFRNALDDYLRQRSNPTGGGDDDAPLLSAALENLVLLISPLAPHIAEEIWEALGHEESIHRQSWPIYEQDALLADEMEIAVQFNGKVRERLHVPTAIALAKDDLARYTEDHERVQRHINGRKIVKVVAVPGRLVNIVLR